ncbi:MAG: apolipoprotein N-acyltransferase [Nitrospinae bacterium]|nr:apolipoprotein N-acyltransferase [Nitrospinota bacterium]
MAWLALIPLFYIIDKGTRREAVRGGFISGFVFFTLLLYWVTNSMTNYGGLPRSVGVIILFVLATYLAGYFALFAWILSLFPGESSHIKWFTAPLAWVALELIRSHLFTGFPWGLIGYSQFDNLRLIQIADITGVYGVSFLIIIVNISLYLYVSNLKDRKKNRRLVSAYLLVSTILIGGTAIYGRKRVVNYNPEEGKPLKVALIQGNIAQNMKWDSAYKNLIVDTYKGMTESILSERPDLIVWPESSLPFYLQEEGEERDNLLGFVDKSGISFLIGADGYRIVNRQIESYNRAYFLTPDNKGNYYDKIHLVPYGEYIPLKPLFPFLGKLVEGVGDFGTGDTYKVFDLPKGRFATLICYEIIFPDLTRKFVGEGAQFLVNITNDAWFGVSSAPYQHIAMVPFRAVENRIPIVRGANTGISGFINPIGNIVQYSDIFVGETLIGDIRLNDNVGKTFYSRYGDIFAYICLLISITAIFYIKFRHKEEMGREDG